MLIKTEKLPLKYRMMFLALIKEAVRQGDEELYRHLYESAKQSAKPYSYAVFLRNFKKKDDELEVEGATLTISCSDPQIAVALINGFQQIEQFTSNAYELHISKIELVKERKINTSIVKFKTLSPLLIEDRNNKPLLIKHPEFEKELNFVCNQQFQAQFNRTLKRPIVIRDYNMQKQVIQEKNRHAGDLTLYFTAQKGEIVLEGDPSDLHLIYQTGCGNRKSQGFGLLEVIHCYDENYRE